MENKNDIYQKAEDFVKTEKLNLAASNLQHFLKIQQEQASLKNIVATLKQSLTETVAGETPDAAALLTTQVRILDAAFLFYIDASKGAYSADDKINIALKAQRQVVRTISMLGRMMEQRNKKIPGTN